MLTYGAQVLSDERSYGDSYDETMARELWEESARLVQLAPEDRLPAATAASGD